MARRPVLQGDKLSLARVAELAEFCARLGHEFDQKDLLEEALTHPSFAAQIDNQRLEFLGDRVLGLVIAERLLELHPGRAEGALAPMLNAMVRKETCADVASEIGLGQVMRIGRSEQQSGGRRKTALLGDAMEAMIAAVFLDSGLGAARALILRLWGDRIDSAEEVARDPKTALQEWAQGRGLAPPVYIELARRGPDHAPLFRIAVEVDSGQRAEAEARSKRAAQQTAAEILLKELDP